MKELIDMLHREQCSLVVQDTQGHISTYHQAGVRDLEALFKQAPTILRGASIADKVIGKAAAGIVCVAEVRNLYAEVLSKKALPLLEAAGISYSYGTLVDQIVVPDGDMRCPLEQIVADATTAHEVVDRLWHHFEEMTKARSAVHP